MFGLLCMVAGQGWAGDAWRAEYDVDDGDGSHVLVVVRSQTQLEYRGRDPGVARIWRRVDDGIERAEVFAGRGAVVVAAPGDLRTLDELPDWDALAEVVPAARRAGLRRVGGVRRFGIAGSRHAGRDASGRRVQLEWLDDVGLPAGYRAGTYRLRLRSLERAPGAVLFTPVAGLRAYDRADLGDMPLDPFARDYLDRFGKHHGH